MFVENLMRFFIYIYNSVIFSFFPYLLVLPFFFISCYIECLFMSLFQLCFDFLCFVFSKVTQIINFFLRASYYYQVQYTIRHDLSSQIEFFEEYIPGFEKHIPR